MESLDPEERSESGGQGEGAHQLDMFDRGNPAFSLNSGDFQNLCTPSPDFFPTPAGHHLSFHVRWASRLVPQGD